MIRTLLSLIGWCGCLGALAVSALGLSNFAAPDFWLADNMSFFLRQFLAAGLLGCLGGALGFFVRHRFALLYKTVWFLAVLALIGLAGLAGARTLANTVEPAPLQAGSVPLKVVSINLEHLFLGDRALQAFLEKEMADIVVLQETLWGLQEQRWQRLGLSVGSAGEHGFPPYLKVGELGGLAIYSRFPVLDETTTVIQGELPPGANVYYNADRELFSLKLETGAGPLNLVAIHPDSPRTESRWLNKRHYFEEADKLISGLKAANDGPVLAIGDWNSSPWSARFQQTLTTTGLKTAYPDRWPQTTRFFFDYRLHWLLGAPVDQFAVSDDMQVLSVSIGPDIGSDHLPLIVELGLAKPGGN
ncbi:endonuclease/exonuclease/phosphatase family protein [Roseibium marinum]|uniref:Endonuclease/exonuclease/phosphatase (EEP) superfamily protein YafD n=1 Tax=Roseibium marinum TaxID=281252 RepID=A0A2S3UQ09_9HYPH|nr:endonuclease/exonuclease/phosphatase family protein [Roseibium marinum]POF29764.1 endonuclease/exonuclease/phosphatase (EEP) superfamily protein YafD [Roseibium marinum]